MLVKSGKTFRGNVWYCTAVSFRHPLCFAQQIPSVPVRNIRSLWSADTPGCTVPVNRRVLLWQRSPFHPYVRKQPLYTTRINTLCVWNVQFFITPGGIYCYHSVAKCRTTHWKIYTTSRKHTCFIPDGVIGIFMDFKVLTGLWVWGRSALREVRGLTTLPICRLSRYPGSLNLADPSDLCRTIQCLLHISHIQKVKPPNLDRIISPV